MTAGGRRLNVYAKTTVVSMTPVRPGKTYPLSALDHSMAAHDLHIVYYYRPGPTMDKLRLKESLSEVLSLYPAVTGRMAREEEERGGGWIVKCNDAGLRMVEARARVTLDEWLATATDEEERELAYSEPMAADTSIWSSYYVQLTEFDDNAVAIGLSCPHIHADPTCLILLVRCWSDAHRRACIVSPPFLHPPAFLPRAKPNPCSAFFSSKPVAATVPKGKLASATFVFSDDAVKSCLADGGLPADFSPFDALTALFWTRIARASAAVPGASLGCADLSLGIDFRKQMYAPLPYGYHGNAYYFYRARADLHSGLGGVAAALRRRAEAIQEEDFWESVEWIHEKRPGRKAGDLPLPVYGPELTVLEIDRPAFAYATAFDSQGGRPVHVTCWADGVTGEGLVMVMPAAAEGAARQVSVTLPEDITARLCGDEAIIKYGPKVILAAAAARRC